MDHTIDFEQLKKSPFMNREYLKFLYFSRQGRINRLRLYFGYLFITIIFIALTVWIPESSWEIARFVLIPPFILFIYMNAMLFIKRAHDVNHSGYFCLFLLIPLLSIWPLLVLFVFEGDSGSNKYGPSMID